MTDHDFYISVQTAYVFPRFDGSDLSCFNVHAPICPIICLPDDKMASAEAYIVDIFFLILLLRAFIFVEISDYYVPVYLSSSD